MALIKDRKLALDSWQLLEAGADGAVAIPDAGDVIVPLVAWRASRDRLIARGGRIGVWLAGSDEPSEIANDLPHLDLIAVQFTSFTDGRGYSIGRLLRQRYGWTRELRAIGDVQRDQLFYLTRCGFDAFSLRAGEDVETALQAFKDFSEAYQTGVDRVVPLFRRREAAGGAR
jgi:uncharacterized protein (DUF934 family)